MQEQNFETMVTQSLTKSRIGWKSRRGRTIEAWLAGRLTG